ncbi:MAG TPA: hypothetical protein VF209_00735 [Patescibacteria group bacterium]
MKQKKSSTEKTLKQQKDFIESLEGLGDILVFLTKNKRNSEVIPDLQKIGKLFQSLLDLRDKDPDKFDKLMLAEEYWALLQKNKDDAQFRLGFYPEKYLISFSFILKQIIRVFETSLKTENEEVTRHASYQLAFFLEKVSEMEQAELLVKEVLKKLWKFSRESLKMKSSASSAATYEWYTHVVFKDYGRKRKGGFLYEEYLELFNTYLLENIKHLINENETVIFKELIGHIVDGVHVPTYTVDKLWDYSDLLLSQDRDEYRKLADEISISKLERKLVDKGKAVLTQEQLEKWKKDFQEYIDAVRPKLNPQNKRKAKKVKDDVENAVLVCFANNTLRRVMFLAGAWAVYKGKASFIKQIWSYKQPPDAGASYGGNDIYPTSLNETVLFFFQTLSDRFPFFWDDHHDSGLYKDKYFLLLLLKYLKPEKPYAEANPTTTAQNSSEAKYPVIEEYVIPFNEPQKLADVKFLLEGLIANTKSFTDWGILKELDLAEDKQAGEELVNKKLIPFLEKIKESAEDKIEQLKEQQDLSQKRIDEFKQQVFDGYKYSAQLRKQFKSFGRFEDRVQDKKIIKKPLIGYDKLERREIFFDDWHVDFGDWGKSYGRGIGEGEDSVILNDIVKSLEVTEDSSIETALERIRITKSTVIFASTDLMFDYFEQQEKFKPYWTEPTGEEKEPHLQGWFIVGEKKVKVYNYQIEGKPSYFAVFDFRKIGTFVQHYPLIEEDAEDYLFQHLRIKVKDLATNPGIVEKWVENPSEWLQTKGDRDAQKAYLSKLVIMQAGEKIEFVPDENIVGFYHENKK